MKKYFICLANSKKYTQRCIAGIELIKKPLGFIVHKKDGEPVWIRPVSSTEQGEVPSSLVDHIKLLDIVEIEVTAASPRGYQSENALFKEQKLTVVRRIKDVEKTLQLLPTTRTGHLFGNKGRAVSAEHVGHLDHSLVLIKPAKAEFRLTRNQSGIEQVRVSFSFNGVDYDLPVTDIDFIKEFTRNREILKNRQAVYLTISLGVEFEGWHYKLVAGVIYFQSVEY